MRETIIKANPKATKEADMLYSKDKEKQVVPLGCAFNESKSYKKDNHENIWSDW